MLGDELDSPNLTRLQAKILLVGSEGVGKTTILKAIAESNPESN